MIPPSLTADIDSLIRRAHKPWLHSVCVALEGVTEPLDATSLISSLPATNNSNAAHLLADVIRQAEGVISWKALGTSLDLCVSLLLRSQRE